MLVPPPPSLGAAWLIPPVVPDVVPLTLRRSSDGLQWIVGIIDQATDAEWESDVAAVYRARLDQVRRMVLGVHTRVREAATAVRCLEIR